MKTIEVIKVPVNGRPEFLTLTGLEGLQGAVGGLIEYVCMGGVPEDSPLNDHELIINEEGKYLTPEINIFATMLSGVLEGGDYIAGDALIVGPTDEEGYTTSVSREVKEIFSNFLERDEDQ